MKTVGESCFRTGYSNVRVTPRKRNVIKGININATKEMRVVGICFPNCSLCLVA